jgi:hypothetical protein
LLQEPKALWGQRVRRVLPDSPVRKARKDQWDRWALPDLKAHKVLSAHKARLVRLGLLVPRGYKARLDLRERRAFREQPAQQVLPE